jgi:hypothetical protein
MHGPHQTLLISRPFQDPSTSLILSLRIKYYCLDLFSCPAKLGYCYIIFFCSVYNSNLTMSGVIVACRLNGKNSNAGQRWPAIRKQGQKYRDCLEP